MIQQIPFVSISQDSGHVQVGTLPEGAAVERNPVGHWVFFPKTLTAAKRIQRAIQRRPQLIERYIKDLSL